MWLPKQKTLQTSSPKVAPKKQHWVPKIKAPTSTKLAPNKSQEPETRETNDEANKPQVEAIKKIKKALVLEKGKEKLMEY